MTDVASSLIRFGTSSWNYPGWQGLVYTRSYRSKAEFSRRCLEEYAQYPLFGCVGIDHAFYRPPSPAQLRGYALQTPPTFRWVSKVWERVTIPKYPMHARYGEHRGLVNPDFLSAALFSREVLESYGKDADVRARTGPFIFQFPTIAPKVMAAPEFFERLHAFLRGIPQEFQYAIEVRNPEFLGGAYFRLLAEYPQVTHCFNHWNFMPPLREQMRYAADAGGLVAPFYVARALTPLGVSYEAAVKLFSPYQEIRRENPELRADLIRFARRAIETKRDAYILVNNRAEGCAPLTIQAVRKGVSGAPCEAGS